MENIETEFEQNNSVIKTNSDSSGSESSDVSDKILVLKMFYMK